MDEYERLETLWKRLKDQERWDRWDKDILRNRRPEVERAIRDLLLAEPLAAATAPAAKPLGDGSLITASRTKGVPLAAASVPPTPPSETDVITPTIPPSRPLPGALMVVCTHVGLCSECVAQADASGLRWWTPAQVVGGTPWVEATPSTSAKQAQPSSAGHRGAGH